MQELLAWQSKVPAPASPRNWHVQQVKWYWHRKSTLPHNTSAVGCCGGHKHAIDCWHNHWSTMHVQSTFVLFPQLSVPPVLQVSPATQGLPAGGVAHSPPR